MPVSTTPSAETIARAATLLRNGRLVAFPTETVYGLGGNARDERAVLQIFAAKGRPADHPLIVHIAAGEQLREWAIDIPDAAWRLAGAFWPGPLTLILKRASTVNDAVTGAQSSIGLRVPAHPVALDLLRAFGDGVAAPSANRFGHVSPTTATHVLQELGDAVDMILDGGPCAVGIESTIVDLTSALPRILRPGQLSRAAVEEVLGLRLSRDVGDAPRVSGALASHYAPNTALQWVESTQFAHALAHALEQALAAVAKGAVPRRVGVIALGAEVKDQSGAAEWRTLSTDPQLYARALYARLRELDALELDLILIQVPPDEPDWEAVRDRLRRAAARS